MPSQAGIVPAVPVFLAIFLFFLPPVYATSQTLSQEALELRFSFYQKLKSLKADFVQEKNLKKLNVILKSSGTLELEPPEKVVWQVQKPAPIRVSIQGNAIEIKSDAKVQKILQESQLDEASSKSLLTLVAWLKMDLKTLGKIYEVRETSPNTFECVSREKKTKVFEKLTFVTHKQGHVTKLIIDETSGDTLTIRFSDPKVVFAP